MRIRIGRRRVAYAGFASVELARIACRHWAIASEHFIEPWHEAVRHDAPASQARQVLLFRDEADFRSWLEHPDRFDVDAHLVRLHPGSVARAQRLSA